jgi:hypothetical protein
MISRGFQPTVSDRRHTGVASRPLNAPDKQLSFQGTSPSGPTAYSYPEVSGRYATQYDPPFLPWVETHG